MLRKARFLTKLHTLYPGLLFKEKNNKKSLTRGHIDRLGDLKKYFYPIAFYPIELFAFLSPTLSGLGE